MIQEANYDDMTLQPGEDREFKNQFYRIPKEEYPTSRNNKKEKEGS